MTSESGSSDETIVAAPVADPDSQFYWDGLRAQRLLVQRCGACRNGHCGVYSFGV